MKTKLLTVLVALFAVSLSANAQTDITGVYTGVVDVSSSLLDPETIPDVPIYVTQEAGDTYALSLKNFIFAGITVGDLDLTGVTAVEDAGVVTLSREGSITGPTINLGIEVPTQISLKEGSVVGNQLSFTLGVSAMGMEIVTVSFTGEKTTTGINVIQATSKVLVVYPTLAKEVINVQGAGRYAIYGQNGSTVKSGVIGKGEINVSSLPAGLYFITVDGKTAKFIKQYH